MESKFENDVLTIYLDGSVDTSNAEQVGKQIEEIRSQTPQGSLVLDLENLKYISSAGLRQILKLRKKDINLKIINCSSEIYEIFEMTGFSEMMNIEKAYRKVSIDGCEVIGEGSNGIVYRLNPDTIIKVYKNNDALESIKRERELAKTALVLGINTAIPFDVVKVGDKYGSVFEMLSAKSITKYINDEPENKDKYIKIFTDMLKEIHSTEVKPGLLPSEKQIVLSWVEWLNGHIPAETYDKLYKLVDAVPEQNTMIHGDYHTNNVHYANGEAILIDMDTLSVGHPIFEFASIFLAYVGYGETDHNRTEKFMMMDWQTASYIWDKLIDFYFEDKDEQFKEDVKLKARIVGYTRCLRRTLRREPENIKLIENSRSKLIDLVNKVDTLLY